MSNRGCLTIEVLPRKKRHADTWSEMSAVDRDHVPFNKRRSDIKRGRLNVGFQRFDPTGRIEVTVEETTAYESGRVQTRTISFNLTLEDAAVLADFIKGKHLNLTSE